MAHVDSFKKNDAKRVLKEYFRELKSYKNDVDLTRTKNNYHYNRNVKSSDDCMRLIQKRVGDIMQGRDIQTQTNIMSTWIVSLPENLPEDKQIDFFTFVYNFFRDRYGADNVIDGMVHVDETTAHMHTFFVPEAVSRKTGNKTVSSASLLTRAELHNCQADLEKACCEHFGIKNLILNGKTKGDGVSLEELKAITAKEKAEREEKKLSVLERKNDRLKTENEELERRIIENYKKIQNMTNLADDEILRMASEIVQDRKRRIERQNQRIEQAEQVIDRSRMSGKRSGKISPADQQFS